MSSSAREATLQMWRVDDNAMIAYDCLVARTGTRRTCECDSAAHMDGDRYNGHGFRGGFESLVVLGDTVANF